MLLGKLDLIARYHVVNQVASGCIFSHYEDRFIFLEVVEDAKHVLALLAFELSLEFWDRVIRFFPVIVLTFYLFDDNFLPEGFMLS